MIDETPDEDIAPVEIDNTPDEDISPLEPDSTPQEEIAPIEVDSTPDEDISPIEPDSTPDEDISPIEVDSTPQEELIELGTGESLSSQAEDVEEIDLPVKDMDDQGEMSIYEQTRMDNLERHEQEKSDNLARYEGNSPIEEDSPLRSGSSGGGDGNNVLSELKVQTELLKQIAEKEGLS